MADPWRDAVSARLVLMAGDVVSVLARAALGDASARKLADDGGHGHTWHTDRIEGTVIAPTQRGGHFVIQLAQHSRDAAIWSRKDLHFVSRGGMTAAQLDQRFADARSNRDRKQARRGQGGPALEQEVVPDDDTASVSSEEDRAEVAVEPNDDTNDQNTEEPAAGAWIRDDHANTSQRALEGVDHKDQPKLLGLNDVKSASLFVLGQHFLPMSYIGEMAEAMQAAGRQKRAKDSDYQNWFVTKDDVLQWLGVWLYILAHHSPGPRSQYFTHRPGQPKHYISELLAIGDMSKHKGDFWFRQMNACFALPTYYTGEGTDEFHRVRRFWDSLRDQFLAVLETGEVLCLDESMIRWLGHGMPGFMCVKRKPTPMGLELHTLCCAKSGILVWFEVFEGAKAMSTKPYNDKHQKHTAQVLRMAEPFFGKVAFPP